MEKGLIHDILKTAACLELENHRAAALGALLSQTEDFRHLVDQAEANGLSNILYHHIKGCDIDLPPDSVRQFQALIARHRRAHRTRTKALVEILDQFHKAGIESILLKGAALSRILYPKPEFRPMGDIDILVPPASALKAQQALRDIGYHARDYQSGYMYEHHHLPGATAKREGLVILVELHRDALSRDVPSSIRFDNLTVPPTPIEIEGRATAALGPIDMLRHLCHHTFEPISNIKLGAVADIYGYAQKFESDIDWQRLHRDFPFVINTLHCLHFLIPLPPALESAIGAPKANPPGGVGTGFTPLSQILQSSTGISNKIRSVFFCSPWWLHVYYQIPPGTSLWAVRLFRHPARVLIWLKRRLLARYRSRHL